MIFDAFFSYGDREANPEGRDGSFDTQGLLESVAKN